MSKQWHPLFAHLLSLLVQDHYEVQPEVPVSDLPRRGDLLLVRRQTSTPPFVGLWERLREWNLIEFKGPTDAPEEEDLARLVHVGTGLLIRLNEERSSAKEPPIQPHQFAFWYLAARLGDPFRWLAQNRLNATYQAGGVWQGKVLGHTVWLVSYLDTDIELDTVPLRLLDGAPGAPASRGTLLSEQAELLQLYRVWLPLLQPRVWQEIQPMAASPEAAQAAWEVWQKIGYKDVKDVIAILPPSVVVDYLGTEQVVEAVGEKRFIEAMGEKRVIEAMGEKRILETMGEKRILETMGVNEATLGQLFPGLTPEEIRDILKRGRPSAD